MPTRRAVLAGVAGAASSTALAGCNGSPLGGDGGSDASEYTDWMPTADDDDAVVFSAIGVADLADIEGVPDGMLPDQQYGVDVENFDLNVRYLDADVFEGTFEPETIRDGIETDLDLTLQERDEYGDFQRYGVEGRGVAVALRSGAAIFAPSDQLESVVDAERGDGERIVDTNDEFDALTSELGTGDLVAGSLRFDADSDSQFFGENELASGQRAVAGDDDTEVTHVFVFTTEDDADESGIRQRYENQSNASDVSSSVDGRVATVGYTVPTDEFF